MYSYGIRAFMNPLRPNPVTGYLESDNPNTIEAFTSDKKIRFLEMGRQYAEKRQLPDITAICDTIGIRSRTFYEHMQQDERFHEDWEEIRQRVYSGLCNEISIKANSKMGIVANLAVLKYLEKGKFSEDMIILNANNSSVKGISTELNGYIEAETVENKPITSTPSTD